MRAEIIVGAFVLLFASGFAFVLAKQPLPVIQNVCISLGILALAAFFVVCAAIISGKGK
jgi:energy-coupling factor transporter transmembrane protein EcfT